MKYIKMLLIICLVALPLITSVDGATEPGSETTQQDSTKQPKPVGCPWYGCW